MRCRARFFNNKKEYVLLGCGLLTLFFAVIDMLGLFPSLGGYYNFTQFLVGYLFLNTTHVVFTFALFALPEIKNWKIEFFRQRKRVSYLLAGLILLSVVFLLAVSTKTLPNLSEGWVVFAQCVALLWVQQHWLAQVRGFSLSYNRRVQLEGKQSYKWEKLERLGFHLVLGFSFLANILREHPEFSEKLFGLETSFFVSLAILAALSTVFCGYMYAKQTYKTLYLLRIILMALAPISVIAFLGTGVIHGVEYFLVVTHMKTKSTANQRESRLFWMLMISFSCLIFVLGIGREAEGLAWLLWPNLEVPYYAQIMAYLSMVLVYTHFAFDMFLYRMKFAATRKHIAPLLS